jgi:hypothetical protein
MRRCGWKSAMHRRRVSGALLVAILLMTAVIGTLLAQSQGMFQGTASEVVLYAFKGSPGADHRRVEAPDPRQRPHRYRNRIRPSSSSASSRAPHP